MADVLRQVLPSEHEQLLHLLERGFGHEVGFFQREMPHWYADPEICCANSYVIETGAGIVAHAGLHPIEMTATGLSCKVGGVGCVVTAPEERGKGHMSRLLQHVITTMRQGGYALSWLAGDRQRYNSYGWEAAGLVYDLLITVRSLEWAAVAPLPMEERSPERALATIEALYRKSCCWAARPRLAEQIARQNLRIWTTEDGYAITRGAPGKRQQIVELVSASRREPRMIRTILEATGASEATWELPACDGERLPRLMPYAAQWHAGPNGMFRIVDLALLLEAAVPHLRRWANALDGYSLCLAIQEHDRTMSATIAFGGGEVQITRGRCADEVIELDILEATRLLLGGPPTGREAKLSPCLLAALPLPTHILPLDAV
ncbi:MAG: GNAT family N-acetyltransferase [Anaerolineae bacterium]|jgi:predicted N-acetyltransferase YhbS